MFPRPATVLVLTPVKTAAHFLDSYFGGLEALSYPHHLLSLGILEGDSRDDTHDEIQHRLEKSCGSFRRKILVKHDFGFQIPDHSPRHTPVFQAQRRAILARARNHLLFRALQDEEWVLWLDVDVVEYPKDVLEKLLAVKRDIVHPHCVTTFGGDSYDLNAWSDGGNKHMSDMRGRGWSGSSRSGVRCCSCGRTGTETAWCFRLSSTEAGADGFAIRIRWHPRRSARSKPRDLPSWPRTWGSNAGGCPIWRSVTDRIVWHAVVFLCRRSADRTPGKFPANSEFYGESEDSQPLRTRSVTKHCCAAGRWLLIF